MPIVKKTKFEIFVFFEDVNSNKTQKIESSRIFFPQKKSEIRKKWKVGFHEK